jgi:RNA polymerase sigma-70 factor (ECF subfamily)
LAVERAKDGDPEALRFLYVRYSHNVYGYVRSIVRDDDAAEDVTQQVFAKLITALVRYEDRGRHFFAWLIRLAHNVAVDELRAWRELPSENLLDPDLASDETDVERYITVRAVLESMRDDQREVIFLRHVVGLSPAEIAVRLGRSEGAIHGLHHRGRRALRSELEGLRLAPSTRKAA